MKSWLGSCRAWWVTWHNYRRIYERWEAPEGLVSPLRATYASILCVTWPARPHSKQQGEAERSAVCCVNIPLDNAQRTYWPFYGRNMFSSWRKSRLQPRTKAALWTSCFSLFLSLSVHRFDSQECWFKARDVYPEISLCAGKNCWNSAICIYKALVSVVFWAGTCFTVCLL